MTPILDRIRANGGEVIRNKWRITLRRGRLNDDAVQWVRANHTDLMREVWLDYDDWDERAAIMQEGNGWTREQAEAAAYECIAGGGNAQLLAA